MRVVEINALPSGSTGNIMFGIADVASKKDIEIYTFSGLRKGMKKAIKNHFYVGNVFSYYIHYFGGLLFGLNECLSRRNTKKMIKRIKKLQPDLIHLHIVHGHYINIKLLFGYLSRVNVPIVWTFHDCWAFTGRCPHFILCNCDKWVTGCERCAYPKKNYPASLLDNSKLNWNKKKKLFLSLKKLTIVVPSSWMKKLVEKSFFKEKNVCIINNGINLDTFRIVSTDFRLKNDIKKKYIILGVANVWNHRKGIDVFQTLALSSELSDYQIVLIGDSSSINNHDKNIICYGATASKEELANIYNAADVFVNPTREDTFPTVNMESLACGTPVITFDTGGSPEIIDETCGCVVRCNDILALKNEIIRVCNERPYSKESCRKRAETFNLTNKFGEYVDLYRRLTK